LLVGQFFVGKGCLLGQERLLGDAVDLALDAISCCFSGRSYRLGV
jgi:hypothetical protein